MSVFTKNIYDPETDSYISEYEKLAKERASRKIASAEPVMDVAGLPEPGVGETAIKEANAPEVEADTATAPKDAKTAALAGAAELQKGMQKGDGLGAIGSGLTTAGIASANPWLVGAGLGLSTVSSVRKGEQAQKEARYKAEIDRIAKRQAALDALANLSKGLKA